MRGTNPEQTYVEILLSDVELVQPWEPIAVAPPLGRTRQLRALVFKTCDEAAVLLRAARISATLHLNSTSSRQGVRGGADSGIVGI